MMTLLIPFVNQKLISGGSSESGSSLNRRLSNRMSTLHWEMLHTRFLRCLAGFSCSLPWCSEIARSIFLSICSTLFNFWKLQWGLGRLRFEIGRVAHERWLSCIFGFVHQCMSDTSLVKRVVGYADFEYYSFCVNLQDAFRSARTRARICGTKLPINQSEALLAEDVTYT